MYDDSKLQAKCDRGKAEVEEGLYEYNFRREVVTHKYPDWMGDRYHRYAVRRAERRRAGSD